MTRGELAHAAELLRTLTERDFKLRYRRSVLGVAWSQLAPLATLAVLVFVFTKVVPLGIPHYALFTLIGVLAWTWFSNAVVGATSSVVGARDLVRRPGFPAHLLPVVAISSHLLQFVLALPVVVVAVAAVTGRVPVTLVALPVVLAAQFLVTLGPGYLLAAFNVRYRDVSHLVGVALLPLFYATPVFYNPARVPARYRGVYELNPLARLLSAYRDALLLGRWPDWTALLVAAAAGALLAALALRLFDARAHEFGEEL